MKQTKKIEELIKSLNEKEKRKKEKSHESRKANMENKRSTRHVTGYKGSRDKYQPAKRIQHSYAVCLAIRR